MRIKHRVHRRNRSPRPMATPQMLADPGVVQPLTATVIAAGDGNFWIAFSAPMQFSDLSGVTCEGASPMTFA